LQSLVKKIKVIYENIISMFHIDYYYYTDFALNEFFLVGQGWKKHSVRCVSALKLLRLLTAKYVRIL